MTLDMIEVMKFDEGLAVGDEVEVRWTSNHDHFAGLATITKLNDCSLKAKLSDAVGSYPAGYVVTVPRLNFRTLLRATPGNVVLPAHHWHLHKTGAK